VDRLGRAPLCHGCRAAPAAPAPAHARRLHHSQRAQGAPPAATYDDLELRIERLLEHEELKAVRPELDGNEIAAVLGIPPGPVLGRAYKYLLSVRLDEGVIGPEAAAERLRAWWAEQPEAAGG